MSNGLITSTHNLLDAREVAAMFRVSYMSIMRLIHRGELRSIRVGRSYRIPRDEVERFIIDNTNSAV